MRTRPLITTTVNRLVLLVWL